MCSFTILYTRLFSSISGQVEYLSTFYYSRSTTGAVDLPQSPGPNIGSATDCLATHTKCTHVAIPTYKRSNPQLNALPV